MAARPTSIHVNVADIEKKIVVPLKATAGQLRKAEQRAIKDALKSTKGAGRKKAAAEYAIKPAGKKKLFDKIRLVQKSVNTQVGSLSFSGDVGTDLRFFPGKPAKTPAVWMKKPGRKGLNPRLRTPKEGVHFRFFKGGAYQTRFAYEARGKRAMYVGKHVVTPANTFWIKLAGHRKSDGADVWVVGYRTRPSKYENGKRVPGGLSRKGLFGPSMIQALGRRDILQALGEHSRERFETRLLHYIDAYMRGILR